MTKNLTLNLGLRYEWYGVPYSPFGLTAAAIGGGSAGFGISGRDFTGWMNPGARGDTTTFQFVGPNSPHSAQLPYNDDWKNFGPAIGFAYQLPWLGENKTTIRGGYQITYQGGGRFNTLENALTQPPGRVYAGIYSGTASNPYLDLTNVTAQTVPTPLPSTVAPMKAIPVTDRTQQAWFFDPNYTSPYIQNLTLSVSRSIRQNVTVDVRYIGTLGRRLYSSVNLNSANFLYNGLGAEFDRIRAGGESPMLDKMMNGVNLCAVSTACNGGQTYGAIGTTVNGVAQTAAYQLRSASAFRTNLSMGNWSGVAGSLNTLNYTQVGCPAAGAAGNCGLPAVDPSVTRGSVMRLSGLFPENFISTNPQFGTVNWFANMGNTNYHSVQVETTLRPTRGFQGTVNYTFSKNLGVPPNPFGALGPTAAFTNPVDRHGDYTVVNNNHPHILRTNGIVELPIGPGKLLLRNSHGALARAFEGWQWGNIYTLSSGAWSSITAQNMLYANGVPDVGDPALLKELLNNADVKWGVTNPAGTQLEGDFFDRTKWIKVQDPQCANVTSLQSLNSTGGIATCTLQAVARIVPSGTAGAIANIDGKGNSGKYVLLNPRPGARGNLGQNVLRGVETWRFDTNLSKSFKMTESKTLMFRLDVFNVLNNAQAGTPNLSINTATTPFGEITSKNAKDPRALQGQLRLQF
jgi:hypothetical protein